MKRSVLQSGVMGGGARSVLQSAAMGGGARSVLQSAAMGGGRYLSDATVNRAAKGSCTVAGQAKRL